MDGPSIPSTCVRERLACGVSPGVGDIGRLMGMGIRTSVCAPRNEGVCCEGTLGTIIGWNGAVLYGLYVHEQASSS